ncbi:MAG: protein kinase [Candidatus Saccharimonas sp.]|nr:protein kinase [Planctomycetaceae bacterium]
MSLVHPQKDQLIAFGQGKLAADESSSVEQHLESCRECCETLLDLKDDTFVGLVRIAKSSEADVDRRMGTLSHQAEETGKSTQPPERLGQIPDRTDGDIAHRSEHAATLLVQSGMPIETDELPVELREHLRYRIVELIGKGGMGNVYRAEHRLMNRPVAIKLINSQLVRHPQAVERFRREVQAAAKLNHPNIVAAYDAEQAGDVHFLVMECVEGTDLASVVKHRGPMPVAEACRCIRQVAEGLQHAHEKGMVHRDIKPHNLMLSAEGQVRILDFGLAGFATESIVADAASVPTSQGTDAGSVGHGQLTTMGSVMGTPDYIAPEQAQDAHSADIRADIYSLGCTLWFLLTGKPPFEADNVLAKLKAHAEHSLPGLASVRDDVSAELSNVVARMMAKNPAERFQTPAEVVTALAPFTQAASPPRRRIGRAIAAAFLFAALVLAAVVIRVETDKGEFEIQATDEVAVLIEKSGVKIRDTVTGREYSLKPGKHPIRSGEYQIDVNELPTGLSLSTEKFRLTRGGEEKVVVTLKPKTGNANATESDEKRLQGKWIAVSGHARKKPLTTAELTQLSITFDGERVEFVQPSGPPTPQAVTFTINSNRNPKQIDFVAPNQKEAMPGIYQFDGDRLKLALIDQDYSRPTNFDPDHRPDHLTATFQRVPVAATLGDEERKVLKAAEAFLGVMDDGKFGELWNMSSTMAKRAITREQASKHYQSLRDTVGKATQRTLQRLWLIDEFPGLPEGRYACVEYKTHFANREGLLFESAVLNFDTDGQWRVNTYAATLEPLPIPRPKTKPVPGAGAKTPRPSAPTPPAAVPVGVNLLLDPSFEATAPTLLPRGWSSWLNDGPDFRCEVVADGRTGQRCLQISGKGTRGVVFANSVTVDRSKRFALKGWAKFEGDKDARAIIKFNYYHGGKWLGVNDMIGVKADQPGWHLLEKTDALDAHPEASTLVATCHVEGNGSAWFDDLELIAYDRDKLPADFESRHGRHNRLTGPLSLERWVGAWETQYVFRESDNSPNETKLTMNTAAERTLGDFFLMSHAKATVGDEERLLFLTFDQNMGAFRQWFFSSNGKVFESRGQWDDATKALELRMLPDASRMTSTERFVDADHIEATARQPFLMSTKEAGRWSSTRKAATDKVDVPVVKAPVVEPAELSQLNKLVGEWTIRETAKPSVWLPDGQTKTSTERVVWILGGKFLMGRRFDEQDQLTTIWLATYEPSEKSHHFWFFMSDGVNGQWRVTWDAASRGFHWRSIDMPAGWIGTGFNRWVDDDTFDNQALIKDEQGRVLLDTTQDKRRKKP